MHLFKILNDENKRTIYDQYGEEGLNQMPANDESGSGRTFYTSIFNSLSNL